MNKCVRIFPFSQDIYITVKKISQHMQIFKNQWEIELKLTELNKGADNRENTSTWEDIVEKSEHINRSELKLENYKSMERELSVISCIRDITQASVLLVLLLRTDLRVRGILGLAAVGNKLNNIGIGEGDIPGKLVDSSFS